MNMPKPQVDELLLERAGLPDWNSNLRCQWWGGGYGNEG